MTRPYFQASIEELEAAFNSRRQDSVFLAALLDELGHRTTLRARRLRQQVQQQIDRSSERSGAATGRQRAIKPKPEPTSLPPQTPLAEAPPVDRRVPSEYPPNTNMPEQVLSAWTALEVLSPPTFTRPEDLASKRWDVAELGPELPWERGEKSRPSFRLYYQVILGSVKLEPAIARLIARYGDTRPDLPSPRGKRAILAAVLLDKSGRLIESPAVAISSFAWGVMAALEGQLTDLARWPIAERQLIERIDAKLRTFTVNAKDDSERPLTREALLKTYQALVDELRLPPEFVEPPTFAIRSYVWFKDPNPAEPPILNSFFLGDLDLARRLFAEGKAPETLRRYLGCTQPQVRIDLLQDEEALRSAVAPRHTPLSRWPGKGRHSLVLLQQAAVNITLSELRDGEILGVNGPPGTGKTTLLRDIVAGVVVERAAAMATFSDPETAFSHSGEKLKAGASWLHLYSLSSSLRGFELVVASSNNKAVENVSAELPALDAVAADARELRYFKSTADSAHARQTWGMIAAVLGNALNRSRFRQTFWWMTKWG
jgi:ABC-type polysaccharide/polyol phosphate transport system, ATPase component